MTRTDTVAMPYRALREMAADGGLVLTTMDTEASVTIRGRRFVSPLPPVVVPAQRAGEAS